IAAASSVAVIRTRSRASIDSPPSLTTLARLRPFPPSKRRRSLLMRQQQTGERMGEKYRVAHVGTGYTGSLGLRHVLRSPRLDLVGHLVHSHEKAGRDSGELVGEAAAGVLATDDFEAIVALDADCVSYFATASGRDFSEVADQLSRLLASGKN